MIGPFHTEVALAGGYATVLLGGGLGVDRLARGVRGWQGQPGEWPHSEASRFYRGMALFMVAVAALFLIVAAVRHHGAPDLALTFVLGAATGATGRRISSRLRTTPAAFPGVAEQGGDGSQS